MKRAYLVNGTLAAQAATADSVLQLDNATWTYLNGLLGTDYCYLVIDGEEVVKVLGVQAPNIAMVVRGLEGTLRHGWPVGTTIKYGLTESEINDAVAYVGCTVTAVYPMQNNGGQLSYAELQFAGFGGVTVDGKDEGIWMIQDITGPAGCCSIVPAVPPPIPISYFNTRVVTEGYYRATVSGNYRTYL